MAQFKAFAPGVEVQGEIVLALVSVMGAFKGIALGILSDNGIKDPQADQWYPQQAWLDSFRTIATEVGPNTLYQIGRQIPDQAPYPANVTTIIDALSGLDAAYKGTHRGGDIGYYRFEQTGERTGRMVCCNPYPCEFDRGIVHSLAQRFEPPDGFVDVEHEYGTPCKKMGADSCTFVVSW